MKNMSCHGKTTIKRYLQGIFHNWSTVLNNPHFHQIGTWGSRDPLLGFPNTRQQFREMFTQPFGKQQTGVVPTRGGRPEKRKVVVQKVGATLFEIRAFAEL